MNDGSIQTEGDADGSAYRYALVDVVGEDAIRDLAFKGVPFPITMPDDIANRGQQNVRYLTFHPGDGYGCWLMIEMEEDKYVHAGLAVVGSRVARCLSL